jgi:hypothetical protein
MLNPSPARGPSLAPQSGERVPSEARRVRGGMGANLSRMEQPRHPSPGSGSALADLSPLTRGEVI